VSAPLPAYDYAPSGCGGLEITLAGVRIVMRASGAVWFPQERLLAAADLHLEKGSAYAARGQLLPPYDTRETLARLAEEAAALNPVTLVFLGDSFHDNDGEGRLASRDVADLEAIGANRVLIWVAGNHDDAGPVNLPGQAVARYDVEGLSLTHEPGRDAGRWEIAGHLHPCARVRGRTSSVRRRCFVTDGERMILPAFGAYAGGLNILDAAFAGLFRRPPLTAALGAGRVHAVGWRSLRPD